MATVSMREQPVPQNSNRNTTVYSRVQTHPQNYCIIEHRHALKILPKSLHRNVYRINERITTPSEFQLCNLLKSKTLNRNGYRIRREYYSFKFQILTRKNFILSFRKRIKKKSRERPFVTGSF